MRHAYLLLFLGLIGGGTWMFADQNVAKKPFSQIPPLSTDAVMSSVAARHASNDRSAADIRHSAERIPSDTSVRAKSDSLQFRLDVMHQRRQGQTYPSVALAAAVERDTAWAPTDEVPKSLPLKPEEFIDGRQFIRLDPLKIESLMPGDTIFVTVEKLGKQYPVKIDSVEVHGDGRISWHGHLEGSHNHYNVTFTRGESLTVGGLETPDGHYVLQAHGANGWIASSQLLFKFNPKEPDYVVPPTDHHHNY
jgi:hypothetical protein